MEQPPDVCVLSVVEDELGPMVGSGEESPMGRRVVVTLCMTVEKANELGAHHSERQPLEILAPEAKAVGTPICASLAVKGYGT